MITIERHNGIAVLRDDLLPGGTKSILLPHMLNDDFQEYVYASPVFGGFQIALSMYCAKIGKRATIFCAKRKEMHQNTVRCIEAGAMVVQVRCGYLSVVEKAAREYCEIKSKARKLNFGANTPENIDLIAQRMRQVSKALGGEPDEVWCAVGSGTLIEGILQGTDTAQIRGVIVGANYAPSVAIYPERLQVCKYPAPFDKVSRAIAPFPSMPNYDLKAWEAMCATNAPGNTGNRLFWNVL